MRFVTRLGARVPSYVWYALLALVSTRIALALIGVGSRTLLMPLVGQQYVWKYSDNPWLDIWGVFDSAWYLSIAVHGYLAQVSSSAATLGQADYAFFPLYPPLTRGLAFLVRDYYVAGIALSNICFFLACISLYKLVRIDNDHVTGLASIRYLLVFPLSFVLSGVFTESLFLLLAIMCFYYARRGRWLLAGLAGFLLALTRLVGVLVFLPILYEYARQKGFNLRRVRPDLCFLFLIPLGLALFAGYNYVLTGDYLAFVHVQDTDWGHQLTNPVLFLMNNFRSEDALFRFQAAFAVALLVLLNVFSRRIGFSYWLLAMCVIFLPLATDPISVPRFSVVVFPIYVLLAKLARTGWIDQTVTALLCLFQGCLIVFWSNGFTLVV
jgi:hypothetical protein